MAIINNFPGYPDNVTQTSDGLMSAEDKVKLDGLNKEDYAITVDDIDEIWGFNPNEPQ